MSLIAGNWKMYKGPLETSDFCRVLREVELGGAEVVVCPPFVSLFAAVQTLAGTEIGVYGTLVGHSERRQHFGETDQTVARRASAALEEGLHVIACVGETESERDAGETESVLRRQVSVLEHDDNLVIAYEPVWAIGTGRTATPEIAQQAHAFIKSLLDAPVLYGGSVKPGNAVELLAQPAIDGALVGGASLDIDSFAAICRSV